MKAFTTAAILVVHLATSSRLRDSVGFVDQQDYCAAVSVIAPLSFRARVNRDVKGGGDESASFRQHDLAAVC